VLISETVEHFPEHPTAYLLDVIKDTLTRTSDFYLLVQRTGWFFPLHLETGNQTYINMMYQQIRPDFLDGNMLVVTNKTLSKSLKVSTISSAQWLSVLTAGVTTVGLHMRSIVVVCRDAFLVNLIRNVPQFRFTSF